MSGLVSPDKQCLSRSQIRAMKATHCDSRWTLAQKEALCDLAVAARCATDGHVWVGGHDGERVLCDDCGIERSTSAVSSTASTTEFYTEAMAMVRQLQQHLEARPTDTGLDVARQRCRVFLERFASTPSASASSPAKGLPPYPLEPVPGCKWPACDCPGRWDCNANIPRTKP